MGNDIPKLSIIMPIYNSEQYISRCIDSILNQSYINYELILIDDGSTDRSYEICQKYSTGDDRIVLIKKRNEGVSTARNKGIEVAKGDYITFVDSDDQIKQGMFSTLMQNVSSNIDLLCTGIEMNMYIANTISDTLEFNMKNSTYTTKSFLEKLNVDYPYICISGPVAKFYKSKIIKENNLEFDISMDIGEDGDFNLKYLERCKYIQTLDTIFYSYNRQNEESLFTKYNKKTFQANELVFNKMRKLFIENNCDNESKVRFEKMYFKSLVNSAINDFKNSHLNTREFRKENLRRLFNNQYIIKNISRYNFDEKKYRILVLLIKLRIKTLMYSLLSIYFNVLK